MPLLPADSSNGTIIHLTYDYDATTIFEETTSILARQADAPPVMGDGDEEPVDDLRQKKKNKDEDDEGGLKFYLKSVVFSGAKYHVVTKDPSNNTDQVYPTPHWEDNSEELDGDAEDDGDKKSPVCYESGAIPKVTVKFKIENADSIPESTTKWPVKGTGPDNFIFEGDADIDRDKGSMTLTTSAKNNIKFTNNKVRIYNGESDAGDDDKPFKIKWEVGTGQTGTDEYETVTTSKNTFYVTHGKPKTTTYHTLLHIGCKNADGKTKENEIVAAIWNEFEDLHVKRVNTDTDMTYWKTETPKKIMREMLRSQDGDGSCYSWGKLFHNTLSVQDISSKMRHIVTDVNKMSFTSQQFIKDLRIKLANEYPNSQIIPPARVLNIFFVNKWSFDENNRFNCIDEDGLNGQGDIEPSSSAFLNHSMVLYRGKYYDPSYGKIFNSLVDFEEECIDGYGFFATFRVSVQNRIIRLKFYWFGAEDEQNEQETTLLRKR